MKRDEITGSTYFNAEDVKDGDKNLVIEDVTRESFKAEDGYMQKKTVITFRGTEKKLSVGKLKVSEIFDLLGDDTDEWIGQRVRLTVGKRAYNGKFVPSIEVALPLALPAKKGTRPVPPPVPVARDEDQARDDDGPDY